MGRKERVYEGKGLETEGKGTGKTEAVTGKNGRGQDPDTSRHVVMGPLRRPD